MLSLGKVLQHEDYDALCGYGDDGMDIINDIVGHLPHLLQCDSPYQELFMECDSSQPAKIRQQLGGGAFDVVIHKDYRGMDRFINLMHMRGDT
jgi:methylase of polypeptide subunit release factors